MFTEAWKITLQALNKNSEKRFCASDIRRTVLKMAYSGSTVHIGCAFSIVEILAVLYRNHLQLDNRSPDDPNRNFLVLSKGHGVMALYAILAEMGWLKSDDIEHYFKDGTRLKGLGDAHIPGVEVTAGSLGHGLSVGAGMAFGAKKRGTDQKCYAIVGDGEMNEGTMWEALLFATHNKLDNLCVIVDENRFQAMGTTEDVMSLGSLKDKFESFGFETLEVDGHDEIALDNSFSTLMRQNNGKPKAVIARTTKGKGISFMENNNIWHYTRLTPETFKAAIEELGPL